jgi:hypothetical protein
MPVVSLTIKNNRQKGPATDYSMLLEMKRRSLGAQNGQLGKTPIGNQRQKPFIAEAGLRSGTTPNGGTQAVEFYMIKGIRLNLYKF